VSHPNVCRVWDLGEHHGQLFLAMEYIDGGDLASLLRRVGRLPAVMTEEGNANAFRGGFRDQDWRHGAALGWDEG
jgi:serine/threonine protein kinase